MATKKKLLQAAAGQAGGEALNVEDVFSTYLYEGTNAAHTITNNIDLTEGGMLWFKNRDLAEDPMIVDTVRGGSADLYPNETNAVDTDGSIASFNSNGFTFISGANKRQNVSGYSYVNWTFRKAPKFFDVVTYTGTGSVQNISHNLGSVPGCIIIKCTSNARLWAVYHRGHNGGTDPEDYFARLNSAGNGVVNDNTYWNDTAPTDSVFTVGTKTNVNASGNTFVAYIFAHNNNDGEFGPDSDADIIKCGSYTGNNNTPGALVDLGFEPQAVFIVSNSSGASTKNVIFDSMRGTITGGDDSYLSADLNNAEASDGNYMEFDSTGFRPSLDGQNYTNGPTIVYSYIAIRRGTKVPESADDVFEPIQAVASGAGNPAFVSTFTTDAAIFLYPNGGTSYPKISSRLTGATFLETHSTGTEAASDFTKWDFQTGAGNGGELSSDWNGLLWKRAPGFFDVVAYTGTGSARTVSHNLGVAPQLIWLKSRDVSRAWTSSLPTSSGISTTQRLVLNQSTAAFDQAYFPSQPTDTTFSIIADSDINANGENYIAYLFASLPGISKVGSYTGTGNTLNVDCGFTSGARFVLIKAADDSGSWYLADSERGIVAGDDPTLKLEDTGAEFDNRDWIDPYSAGFTITSTAGTSYNASGTTYIFYAIA